MEAENRTVMAYPGSLSFTFASGPNRFLLLCAVDIVCYHLFVSKRRVSQGQEEERKGERVWLSVREKATKERKKKLTLT